jgi:hypothetical protein
MNSVNLNSLELQTGQAGYVFFRNAGTGQNFFPCDAYGNLLNYTVDEVQNIRNVRQVTTLGWIEEAIQAGSAIFSSINKSKAQKASEQAAIAQLDREQQLQTLQTQGDLAIIQAQQAAQNSQVWSTGKIIGVAAGGVAILGGIVYMIVQAEKTAQTKPINGIKKPSKK